MFLRCSYFGGPRRLTNGVYRCNPQPKAGMAYSLRRCFWAFATLRLTAGGYKTLSAAFGVAYEPYSCLSCP